MTQLLDPRADVADRPHRPLDVVSTAETAECTCPEFCERDHELD